MILKKINLIIIFVELPKLFVITRGSDYCTCHFFFKLILLIIRDLSTVSGLYSNIVSIMSNFASTQYIF